MKLIVSFTFGLLVINSLFPVSIFFYSLVLSLCVLGEVGLNFSDVLAFLSFMVYISGITAVIGYFVTFFPKKLEGRPFHGCVYSWAYMLALVFFNVTQLGALDYGFELSLCRDYAFNSMSFYGFVVQFLAPLLFIIMVAVISMSKPEEMTLRRWEPINWSL
uniref:NADH dehydrogenase subunit 6 n=1 Tax=Crassostrea talonata TaxID=1356040 RepID=A0A342KBC5_9BIVA|nr:NADH dehydrogenase subunit 6 [Crassostrea talonata]ANC95456.1 NADH dehydrogenase subunit 6 [Crassostrea talonata]ANC95468.1 NADH dehydrogenase subunit 6 [Crassostrea talonata]UOU85759.1 NADH dehydrogenase subunit 6 [Crassostrea talonata]